MALSMEKRPLDRIFFVYDHSVVRKEEDDPKDAIAFFYPRNFPVDVQCLLCGQLMGMVHFIKNLCLAEPKVYKMKRMKVTTKHEGNFTVALCHDCRVSDTTALGIMDQLYGVFCLFHGSITRVLQRCQNNRELFEAQMTSMWNCYLLFARHYGNTVGAIFHSIPTTELPKTCGWIFLKCSHLLQWLKRKPTLLAGCLLYKNKVLCTQLTAGLTSRLLLIKLSQSHFPGEKRQTDFDLPFGVRILSVFLREEEYKLFAKPKAAAADSASTIPCMDPAKDTRDAASQGMSASASNHDQGGTDEVGALLSRQQHGDKEDNAGVKNRINGNQEHMEGFVDHRTSTGSSCVSSSEQNSPNDVSGDSEMNDTDKGESSTAMGEGAGGFKGIHVTGSERGGVASSHGDGLSRKSGGAGESKHSVYTQNTNRRMRGKNNIFTRDRSGKRMKEQYLNMTNNSSARQVPDGSVTVPVNVEENLANGGASELDVNLNAASDHHTASHRSSIDGEGSQQCVLGNSCRLDEQVDSSISVDDNHRRSNQGGSLCNDDPAPGSREGEMRSDHPLPKVVLNQNAVDSEEEPFEIHINPLDSESSPEHSDSSANARVGPDLATHRQRQEVVEDTNGNIVGSEENGGLAESSDSEPRPRAERMNGLVSVSATDASSSVLQGNSGMSKKSPHQNTVSGPQPQLPSSANDTKQLPKTTPLARPTRLSELNSVTESPAIAPGAPSISSLAESALEGATHVGDPSTAPPHSTTAPAVWVVDDAGLQVGGQTLTQTDKHISTNSAAGHSSQTGQSNGVVSDPHADQGSRPGLEAHLDQDGGADGAVDGMSSRTADLDPSQMSNGAIKKGKTRSRPPSRHSIQSPGAGDRFRVIGGDNGTDKAEGMVNVYLYVQAHSDTVLLFLGEKEILMDKMSVLNMWQSFVIKLAELEMELQQVLDDKTTKQEQDQMYNFLRFSPFERSLQTNMTNIHTLQDKEFGQTIDSMHEMLSSDDTIDQLTVKGQQSTVMGRQNSAHETFFQLLRAPQPAMTSSSSSMSPSMSGSPASGGYSPHPSTIRPGRLEALAEAVMTRDHGIKFL